MYVNYQGVGKRAEAEETSASEPPRREAGGGGGNLRIRAASSGVGKF
jgi:hypothetical protein